MHVIEDATGSPPSAANTRTAALRAAGDPVAEALDRARSAWISDRDGRQLRRDLLHLIAELED
jgi:hypothetical protein